MAPTPGRLSLGPHYGGIFFPMIQCGHGWYPWPLGSDLARCGRLWGTFSPPFCVGNGLGIDYRKRFCWFTWWLLPPNFGDVGPLRCWVVPWQSLLPCRRTFLSTQFDELECEASQWKCDALGVVDPSPHRISLVVGPP